MKLISSYLNHACCGLSQVPVPLSYFSSKHFPLSCMLQFLYSGASFEPPILTPKPSKGVSDLRLGPLPPPASTTPLPHSSLTLASSQMPFYLVLHLLIFRPINSQVTTNPSPPKISFQRSLHHSSVHWIPPSWKVVFKLLISQSTIT